MKINNIQVQNSNYNRYKNQNKPLKPKDNPTFKGGFAINFWDAIARGGFAASFMVQDVTGTCIPRTYQSLNRNKEITGKKNYIAATETALREFITGPSMVVIPMGVLAAAKKFSGRANDVPMENIAPFSDIMKNIMQNTNLDNTKALGVDGYTKELKKSFYEKMFSLSLGEKGEISDTAKELASDLMQYDSAKKRNMFQQLLNKDLVKKEVKDGVKTKVKVEAKDQIASRIVTKYTDYRKTIDGTFDNLLNTDLNGTLKKPNKISSLIKDFSNFGNDVAKTIKKDCIKGYMSEAHLNATSFMDEFKTIKTGSKFLTNFIMVAATALFMSQIPKLYSISKTNPETAAFRNESGEVVRANK